MTSTEPLGPKIRRRRRKLGLTLDDLAGRTGISKPYLSLIETGRVPNPPSDEKLRRLEQALNFAKGELLTQAHLQRTPRDVRAVLQKLLTQKHHDRSEGSSVVDDESASHPPSTLHLPSSALNLDDAYLSGVLQELVEQSAGNIERVTSSAIPIVNRVSAGYPKDFTDLSYPPTVADDYVSCPDVQDKDAFAARVHGDSMAPKYREGDIVIFSPAAAPRDGDDCFIRFAGGDTTFKRIFFELADEGGEMVRLQPRNQRYRAQIVPMEEVTGIYKALYRYQRVDDE